MSDMTNVAPGGGEGAPASEAVSTPAVETHSPSDLGRMLASLRHQKATEAAPEEEAAPEAEQELAAEANAAPAEEQAHGETQEAEPEPAPPIEPPRSLTKEQKEAFKLLPPEVQRHYADLERTREVEFRRGQNEAAELRKAAEAERTKAEQARQQYEAALPAVMQALQDATAGQFGDIRTVDDLSKLAADDPLRYLQWQAHQTKLQAVKQQMQEAQERADKEKQADFAKFVNEQNALFAEKVPEFADKAKAKQLVDAAVEVLHDKGFSDADLAEIAKDRLIHDHRFQLLIYDAIKWRDAQKARATVTAKPVPPVQRPGVAPPKGAAQAEKLKALSAKLERTGDIRDLANLIGVMRTGA